MTCYAQLTGFRIRYPICFNCHARKTEYNGYEIISDVSGMVVYRQFECKLCGEIDGY